MTKLDVCLARLGAIICENSETNKLEFQCIDYPEVLKEDWELNFTPPKLRSDLEARKVVDIAKDYIFLECGVEARKVIDDILKDS